MTGQHMGGGSPTRPCSDQGEQEIREFDRWLVGPAKLANEASGAAGSLSCVPVAEGPYVPSAAYSAVSNSKVSRGGRDGVSLPRIPVSPTENIKKFRIAEMTMVDSQVHDGHDYRSSISVDQVMDDLSQDGGHR